MNEVGDDLYHVLSEYVDFESTGDGFMGLCPFHSEKTPSFKLYPKTNSAFCFGCGWSGDSIQAIMDLDGVGFKDAKKKVESLTGEEFKKRVNIVMPEKNKNAPKKLPKDIRANFRKDKEIQTVNYRGISWKTDDFYSTLSKIEDGKVVAQYYPETYNNYLVGYKCRNHPKDFTHGNIGTTGGSNQLSGQHKYKGGGKYILIVGGELDKAAAHQMFEEYNANKSGYSSMPVVSPTCGELSAAKQCAREYDFLNQYDNIIIGMDNDEAGKKAAKAVAEVLPTEKVKIVTWSCKDPNQMLVENKSKQFIRDFYNAKEYSPSGIKSSTELFESAKEELLRPVVSLPPHMHRLQERFKRGGIGLGTIVNIIGNTSVGKTSHVNDIVYHCIFNSPYKVGVVSLELTAGEYLLEMLSIHLEKNFGMFLSGEEVLGYLEDPKVQESYRDLLEHKSGEPRWSILDEREGKIKKLEQQEDQLINQHGCKIIVVDVLSDVLRGQDNAVQEEHMKWQKYMIKKGVTFINVLHTRKPAQQSDGSVRDITEYDAIGSSSFVQSAHVNILLNRDKLAEDEREKNTTRITVPKSRGGSTGDAGKLYYERETRKVYDYEDLFGEDNKDEPFEDDQQDDDKPF